MTDRLMALWAGINPLTLWLVFFVVGGLAAGVMTGFFKARKIQPNGFKWKTLRFEFFTAMVTLAISAAVLGYINKFIQAQGWIKAAETPATWWVVALEYVASFVLFDTYFYWLHRWMHKEPVYSWVHKLHHRSTSPNLLTTLSVHPFESLINGGFSPLFLMAATALTLPIHKETLALMGATTGFMGPYVHAGYEFLPRWWHRTWATKWFITTTFHDQHHRYFNWNFGGYTPVWDYLCGTVRKKYESDFEKIVDRRSAGRSSPVAETEAAAQEA
ncbi:MAG: sterol desaturase family protein [Novosphingobium sp.]